MVEADSVFLSSVHVTFAGPSRSTRRFFPQLRHARRPDLEIRRLLLVQVAFDPLPGKLDVLAMSPYKRHS